MDVAWQELIRAVPWGAVIIILRYLDIKEKAEERKERDTNAKEKADQDRQTQVTVAKAYADAINSLVKVIELSNGNIVQSIREFKETTLEQYKNMGITQDLLDIAKETLSKKDKTNPPVKKE